MGFDEDAAEFASVEIEIVRPFEVHGVTRLPQRFSSGEAEANAEGGSRGRLRVVPVVTEDNLSGEGGLPVTATAATSSALVFSEGDRAVCRRMQAGENAVGGIGYDIEVDGSLRAGGAQVGGIKQFGRWIKPPAVCAFCDAQDAARVQIGQEHAQCGRGSSEVLGEFAFRPSGLGSKGFKQAGFRHGRRGCVGVLQG